jgi:hypothetical protein
MATILRCGQCRGGEAIVAECDDCRAEGLMMNCGHYAPEAHIGVSAHGHADLTCVKCEQARDDAADRQRQRPRAAAFARFGFV